jgi:hypothetical protein
MTKDNFQPRLGRIRDAKGQGNLRTTAKVFRDAGKAGARAVRLKGHVSPSSLRRGMGTGALAAAGLIAPGSRRVIVKARYTRQRPGDLGAAKAHLRYIQRDGVTREGLPGRLYDASSEDADLERPFSTAPTAIHISSASWSPPRTASGSPTSSRSSATSCARCSKISAPRSIGSPSIISTPGIRTRTSHPRKG